MDRVVNYQRAAVASGPKVAVNRRLLALLAVAFLVRLLAILAFPGVHHPDENFQLFEQGHRLAFGYGVVPWEFRDGIRSPVLPYILAAIFAVAEPLVGGPEGYLIVARLLLAISSLAAVAAVYRMALRIGLTHALIAGIVAATWFELVYFAIRPLTEAVATTILLVALSLASVSEHEMSRRRLVAIGFCIGLCLMLRIHLAPGLMVLAIWVGRHQLRGRWVPMMVGAIPPVLLFGAADWIVWGAPFQSYFEAVRVNLLEGKASIIFGTDPFYWYFQPIFVHWAGALPIIVALIVRRARASMLWVAVSLTIIASHMLIPHKEYRFIVPALACLIVVAALGSADIVDQLRRGLGESAIRTVPIIAVGLWIATSAALSFSLGYLDQWLRHRAATEAFFGLAQEPQLCGLLFLSDGWSKSGGYAHLHRNVPLYAPYDPQQEAKDRTAAFNAIVLRQSNVWEFAPEFTLRRCIASYGEDDVCIMTREGSCTPAPDLEINTMLRRLGK